MGTILIATGESGAMTMLNETVPAPMIPLVDRPFIQHVVEFLVGQGTTGFDVILSHLPQQIEKLLGDGSRWGCSFRYHLVRDPGQIQRVVRTIAHGHDGSYLLADATAIPQVDVSREPHGEAARQAPVLYCLEHGGSGPKDAASWTGWAWLPGDALQDLPALPRWGDLYPWVLDRYGGQCSLVTVPCTIRMDSYTNVLAANARVLDKGFPDLLMTGREVEDGVWLARNVVIQPGARITPPVYVGQNCRIGRGVHLGPYAAIGGNCVLDDNSSISNALVFPNTYVGESLELKDVIVERNRLINERFGSGTTITDEFILSSIREEQVKKWLSGVISRVFAALILALVLPFLPAVYLYLRARHPDIAIRRDNVVRLPAEFDPNLWKTYSLFSLDVPRDNPGQAAGPAGSSPLVQGSAWRHFLCSFLPGLVNVIRGDLQVVGVQPRAEEEVMALEAEWRLAYLRSKAGLVTESYVNFGPRASSDEVYSAEMLYSTSFTRKKDMALLGRYFRRIIRDLFRGRGKT
jgi:NDP-sugar pyrophosphorylase family protein